MGILTGSWADDPNRLRSDDGAIRALEEQIAAIPRSERSHYQLMQRGITIPPGYRLDAETGRLKYVAVDNSQNWYTNPKVMFPLIAGAGLGIGALGGFGAQAANPGLLGASGGPTVGGGTGASLTSLNGAPIVAGGAPAAASVIPPAVIPPAAKATSWFTGSNLASLGGQAAGLISGIYANRSQLSASERAAEAQREAARAAAALEAKAAADQLTFLREQEARRQMEWEKTQALNREQYERALLAEKARYDAAAALEQQKLGIDQKRYDELQARLAPYREMGQNAFNKIGNSGVAPGGYVVPRATIPA